MTSMSKFSSLQSPTPPSGGGTRFILLAVCGFVIVNALGFLAYRVLQSTDAPAAQPAPPVAVIEQPPPQPAPEENANESLIRVNRAAGLQAFEDGDYDLAVEKLTKAATLGGAGDIAELLFIAKEMQERASERKQDNAVAELAPNTETDAETDAEAAAETDIEAAADEDPAKADAQARADERRAAERANRIAAAAQQRRIQEARRANRRASAEATARRAEEEEAEAASEEKPEQPGTLLVTSTPSKLVILINGNQRDLTPAKLELPAGNYRVALVHEGEQLHAQTVQLEPGGNAFVNRDLSSAIAAKQKPAQTVARAPAEDKPAPTPTRAKPVEPSYGELYIQSPNVYGEVYVNGKKRGFPPLVVKNVPVGKARVEIRVQGETRRAKLVRVSEGERAELLLR